MKYYSARVDRLLPALAIAVGFIASCQGGGGSKTTLGKRPTSMTREIHSRDGTTRDTTWFTYDSKERLVIDSSATEKTVYHYDDSTHYSAGKFENGELISRDTLFVNAAFHVDSIISIKTHGDPVETRYFYTGRLVTGQKVNAYSNTGQHMLSEQHAYTYDNKGNAVKDVCTLDGRMPLHTVHFTFTDKPVQFFTVPAFFPTIFNNLPASYQFVDNTGKVTVKTRYSFEYDGEGRIDEERDSADNGQVTVISYQY